MKNSLKKRPRSEPMLTSITTLVMLLGIFQSKFQEFTKQEDNIALFISPFTFPDAKICKLQQVRLAVIPIHISMGTEMTYTTINQLPYYLFLYSIGKSYLVIFDRLTTFIKHKNLQYPHQHGFQTGHSISMPLLDTQIKIIKAKENKE